MEELLKPDVFRLLLSQLSRTGNFKTSLKLITVRKVILFDFDNLMALSHQFKNYIQ